MNIFINVPIYFLNKNWGRKKLLLIKAVIMISLRIRVLKQKTKKNGVNDYFMSTFERKNHVS
jgi:hypothetical protein